MAAMYLCYPLIARFLFTGERWTRTVVLCGLVMVACLRLDYERVEIYRNCEIALTRFVIFIIGCALGQSVKDGQQMPTHYPALGLLWIILNCVFRRQVPISDVWIRFSYIPLCLSAVALLCWLLDRL